MPIKTPLVKLQMQWMESVYFEIDDEIYPTIEESMNTSISKTQRKKKENIFMNYPRSVFAGLEINL